jgi:2,3-dihydro-2,3-dihydroxybenzoate dehydrogenase
MENESGHAKGTALITGAAGGIGKVLCYNLAKKGYTIAAADSDFKKAEEVADQIAKDGFKASSFHVDVKDYTSVVNARDAVIDTLGPINVLINSAGVFRSGSILESSSEDWDFHFDINGKGTFFCCKAVGIHMVEQNRGNIVNIASISAKKARPKSGLYGASKAAVAHFTRVLALELAQYMIRANCVCPVATETEMINEFAAVDPNFRKWIIKGNLEDFRGPIPLGRLAQPQDISNLICFLVSEEASFLTGQTYFVDGGMVIVG